MGLSWCFWQVLSLKNPPAWKEISHRLWVHECQVLVSLKNISCLPIANCLVPTILEVQTPTLSMEPSSSTWQNTKESSFFFFPGMTIYSITLKDVMISLEPQTHMLSVNKKYVTFCILSFSFYFYSYIFLELGGNLYF